MFACWLPFQLSPFDVTLYDRMGLYALAAIGLTLLMGFAGQISLGQGAFFLIGGYTSAILRSASTRRSGSSIPARASRRSSRCWRRPS